MYSENIVDLSKTLVTAMRCAYLNSQQTELVASPLEVNSYSKQISRGMTFPKSEEDLHILLRFSLRISREIDLGNAFSLLCATEKQAKTMKSKTGSTNNIRKQLVWTFLTLSLFTAGCKKEKSRICELYDNDVEYAIGTIQSISTSPFKATYKYDFTAQGENYNGKEKAYGIGQKDETLIGKQFIVIYALGDPSNSDLNTDFLIETEADFDDFSSDYSSGPPPPDFPNKCK